MRQQGVLAAIVVVALAVLAIWVAGSRIGGGDAAADAGPADAAYDYEAHDVVVRQMGPDGALQYEVVAKQITQLPRNGQISAQDVVVYHDPAGTTAGGPDRWTLTADRADLPASGSAITAQGNVHAKGRPPKSRTQMLVASEQLTYDMDTEDLSTTTPVDFTWGDNRSHCSDMHINFLRGSLDLGSCNATIQSR